MNSITKRVKDVVDYSGLTIRDFAKKIGIPQTTLYSQLSGHRSISIITIQKIVKAYPEIEERWLLIGDGQMLSIKALIAQKRMK